MLQRYTVLFNGSSWERNKRSVNWSIRGPISILNRIREARRISDRITQLRIELNPNLIASIQVHAPSLTAMEEEVTRFYEDFEEIIRENEVLSNREQKMI